MISVSSSKELEKIIRLQLITQSELPGKKILNSLDVYGQNLNKNIDSNVFDSYSPSDEVIIFELFSRPSSSDISFTEEIDENISYYKTYELRLYIYGNTSTDLANKIAARFRTQLVRESLLQNGVYLEKIEEPNKINEFINNVLWIRNDVSILISCKFTIPQIKTDTSFETLNELKIIKEEN